MGAMLAIFQAYSTSPAKKKCLEVNKRSEGRFTVGLPNIDNSGLCAVTIVNLGAPWRNILNRSLAHLTLNASFSVWLYLFSTSVSEGLMKCIGYQPLTECWRRPTKSSSGCPVPIFSYFWAHSYFLLFLNQNLLFFLFLFFSWWSQNL